MAVNQADHMAPGLSGLFNRIERLTEPGSPRAYWDATASDWSAAPGSHVAVVADPDQPGIYLTQVASKLTANWPDGQYRCTLINPALAPGDVVIKDPYLITMMSGDGGGLGYPSAMVPWLGGMIQLYGARFMMPPVPPTVVTHATG